MPCRSRGTALLAMLALASPGLAPGASAQVTFQGSTSGTFNDGAATLGGLSFTGDFFGPFVLNDPGDNRGVSFGTLNLNRNVAFNYGQDIFNLLIRFSQPWAEDRLFEAALSGNITRNQTGNLNVRFDPSEVFVSDGTSFRVEVFDLNGQTFNPSSGPTYQTGAVAGRVTLLTTAGTAGVPGTVTPEPVSLLLMGTGLAGVGLARRRRRTDSAVS